MKIPEQDKVSFKSKYQSKILEHWQEIRGTYNIPKSRDFRPQDFARNVTQLAMLKYNTADKCFKDKILGSQVSQALHIAGEGNSLSASHDKEINSTIQSLLRQARQKAVPLYFEGTMTSDLYLPIDYSALALPFSDNETPTLTDESLSADTVLLAFEFKKNTSPTLS